MVEHSRGLAELFDRVAPDYDQAVPFFATFGTRLVDWAELPRGARVLDLGSGRGAVTAAAVDAVGSTGSVLAADISPEMAARLRAQALPHVDVQVMDAQALDLADESFDAVLSGFLLHILPDPGTALVEIARVLKPGGLLAMSVPGPSADGGWWAAYGQIVAEFATRVAEGSSAGMTGPPDSWEACAEQAGFTYVDREHTEVALPISGPEAHWSWLLSHGNRWLHDALDETSRAEFREQVLHSLRHSHPAGGTRLIAGAELHKMIKRNR
nr:methyltransferase domain-containing protein [Kibdelosporangium sp. MJ126-NF4]